MVSRRATGTLSTGAALALAGAATLAAWELRLWGALFGALIVVAWMLALLWRDAAITRSAALPSAHHAHAAEAVSLRLLLDQVPVPLLSVDVSGAHAINRAARAVFGTDDRILPVPDALIEADNANLDHEGRRWRINRVETPIETARRTIVALVDVEAEARSVEARVTAEMIQVLGHELLNGLAPIVSLAESGVAALAAPTPNMALLIEILATLARRTEGLLRFAEAYRAMARLPEPVRAPVDMKDVANDLALLFFGRWAETVVLDLRLEADIVAAADRDQITQAIWSLLQNGAEAALSIGGKPSVTLNIRRQDDRIAVRVSDTGGGLAPEDAGRIFRPFHTTKPLGTGVGLSLARQIARAHGGDLTLMQFVPATFYLLLPTS